MVLVEGSKFGSGIQVSSFGRGVRAKNAEHIICNVHFTICILFLFSITLQPRVE